MVLLRSGHAEQFGRQKQRWAMWLDENQEVMNAIIFIIYPDLLVFSLFSALFDLSKNVSKRLLLHVLDLFVSYWVWIHENS